MHVILWAFDVFLFFLFFFFYHSHHNSLSHCVSFLPSSNPFNKGTRLERKGSFVNNLEVIRSTLERHDNVDGSTARHRVVVEDPRRLQGRQHRHPVDVARALVSACHVYFDARRGQSAVPVGKPTSLEMVHVHDDFHKYVTHT